MTSLRRSRPTRWNPTRRWRRRSCSRSAHPAQLDPRNNEIRIHTWGNEECCLARRHARGVSVHRTAGDVRCCRSAGAAQGRLPAARGGDGSADRAWRRTPIRRTGRSCGSTRIRSRPTTRCTRTRWWTGELQRRERGDPALPLLRVRWRRDDALAFPLCLSARPAGRELIRNVSVARGNLVLADHGADHQRDASRLPEPVPGDVPFRLRLSRGPLTHAVRAVDTWTTIRRPAGLATERDRSDCGDARSAQPAVALLADVPDRRGVVDAGARPAGQHAVRAAVRRRGRRRWPRAAALRRRRVRARARRRDRVSGGLPRRQRRGGQRRRGGDRARRARGPLDVDAACPQSAGRDRRRRSRRPSRRCAGARRRRSAPSSSARSRRRTTWRRRRSCRKLPARSPTFRWTGSWYTVFVAIDPRDPADLVRRPQGLAVLYAGLEQNAYARS